MKNQRTQTEWYALALKASDTIFARQRELFDGMSDTLYYFVEVTRFDTFVKIDAGVFAKTYHENTAAKKVAEYLNSVSENVYLSEYTDEDELDNFVPATIKKMESFAAAAKNIIENI